MPEIVTVIADSVRYGVILSVVEIFFLVISTLGFNAQKRIELDDLFGIVAKFCGLNIIFMIILNKVL